MTTPTPPIRMVATIYESRGGEEGGMGEMGRRGEMGEMG